VLDSLEGLPDIAWRMSRPLYAYQVRISFPSPRNCSPFACGRGANVGGAPPVHVDGKLLSLQVFNYTFNHTHDAYVDSAGALYVAQWWSSQTYPIKLVPLS
jgi:hypothetical protein